tara:strand:- start:377 stop:1126 length:750 start_codon:yes stop_codon:yes gene_type:complete
MGEPSINSLFENISELQNQESDIYDSLQTYYNNQNLDDTSNIITEDQYDSLLNTVNDLASTRVNLYNSLNTIYTEQVDISNQVSELYNDQMRLAEATEKNLQVTRRNLDKLTKDEKNKAKMIEITTYESKRLDAIKNIIILIIVYVIILIIFQFLRHIIVGKRGIVNFIHSFIVIIGLIIILEKIRDYTGRSNTNFDEYNFDWFDNNTVNSGPKLGITGDFSLPKICVDSTCCGENTVWADNEGCVAST